MSKRANEPAYPAAGVEQVAEELRSRMHDIPWANPAEWNPRINAFALSGAGLTLREHFAGLAMQGLLARGRLGEEGVAKAARTYADALLAELERTP